MDITVYLPDELGQRAKTAELNLSRLLRDAVTDELERRAAVSSTLKDAQEYLLDLEDDEGRSYVGRLTGVRLSAAGEFGGVYLADDQRVLLHDSERGRLWEIDYPETELRDHLDDDDYIDAMNALGHKPIIDI
jgi:hypothetical protein